MLRKFVIWDSKASPEEPAEMLRPDMEECPEKYAGREASRIEAQFLKEWEKGGLRDERAMLYPHLENPVLAACCHDEAVTRYWMLRFRGCEGYRITEHYVYRETRNIRHSQKLLWQINNGGASYGMLRQYTRSMPRL